MTSVQKTVTVNNHQGLHARPAAVFVQVATRFASRITVKKGRRAVDGKSIMGLLTLAANRGARVSITAEGPDAPQALESLSRLLAQPTIDAGTVPGP